MITLSRPSRAALWTQRVVLLCKLGNREGPGISLALQNDVPLWCPAEGSLHVNDARSVVSLLPVRYRCSTLAKTRIQE
jgi:hypothetical protein